MSVQRRFSSLNKAGEAHLKVASYIHKCRRNKLASLLNISLALAWQQQLPFSSSIFKQIY